jgi:hypothetical protein
MLHMMVEGLMARLVVTVAMLTVRSEVHSWMFTLEPWSP